MNENESIILGKHEIKMIDKSLLIITGIKNVNSFCESEFNIETIMGNINIIGKNMEIQKLDTTNGILNIKGNIDNLIYQDISKNKKESILNKLFK